MLLQIYLGSLTEYVALAAALIMAIVMIQSGLDKVLDYKGNKEFLKSHFSKTFLAKTVGLLLPVITLLELAGGLLCVAGLVLATFNFQAVHVCLFYAFLTVLLAFAALMFGQRVAKDYAGAGGLTGYITIALIGLFATLV